MRAATRVAMVLPLCLSACAYDPPVVGDHTSDKYLADLDSCTSSATETVRLKNAATPVSWLTSPFNGPPEVRADIRSCMTGKGYVLAKPSG